MAVSIRMKRIGSNQRPFYRLVVAESKRATQGRFLECVGTYHPRANGTWIRVDAARVEELVKQGARMTPTVARLLNRAARLKK